MTDMCTKTVHISLICIMHVCNTTNSLKYKKRRIRRRRIAPMRRIRRDKKRIRKRKDPKTIEKKNRKN
jgi:hypothetical protein